MKKKEAESIKKPEYKEREGQRRGNAESEREQRRKALVRLGKDAA